MTRIGLVYEHAQDAVAAFTELKRRGFSDVMMSDRADDWTVSPEANPDAIAAAPTDERSSPVGTLVVVNAPFGSAAAAIRLLEQHGTGKAFEFANAAPRHAGIESDWVAAPLSTALALPVLISSKPTPSLTRPRTLSSILGIPELVRFSALLPLLTKSQRPFSSLSSSQRGWSKLSRNQNGHASLIENPTPLSSLLGLPVLLR